VGITDRREPTVITFLLVVLYGCGTWSLIMREDHRLKVFENGWLRGIFGPRTL
jgi:hypothetical protein